jgi:6-phosphogluconolactonase
MLRHVVSRIAITSAFAAVCAWADPGAVYTMTNAAAANDLVVYARMADGSLGAPSYVPTGGKGSGAGLGSQGAIALSQDGHWLLAVNAGSNNVSLFSVDDGAPALRGITPSGGVMPISVTLSGDMAVVLNAGGTPNLSAYLIRRGSLVPAGSKALSGSGPAQVSFDDRGGMVAVTDKGTSTIETFAVDDGNITGPVVTASSGATPFGFAFARRDVLIVSEAANSSVSSYALQENGSLRPITSALPDTQGAACWAVATRDGRFAYLANNHTASISSVAVHPDGSLSLLNATAGLTPSGTAPIDLAVSNNSRYLYSLASGTISVFRVEGDGSLAPVQLVSGLPASDVGLIAR